MRLDRERAIVLLARPHQAGRRAGADLRIHAAQAQRQVDGRLEREVTGPERKELVEGIDRPRRRPPVAERTKEVARGRVGTADGQARESLVRIEVNVGRGLQVAARFRLHVLGHQPLVDEALVEGRRGRGPTYRPGDGPQVGTRPPSLRRRAALAQVSRGPATQVGRTPDHEVLLVGSEDLAHAGTRGQGVERLGQVRLQGDEDERSGGHGRRRERQASAGESSTWSWIVTRRVISYSFMPEGTRTSTTSPSSWFRRLLPMGDEGEMRPCVGSASSGVTRS